MLTLTERAWTDEPIDAYVGTCLLRDICVAHGVDALEYPTVTGRYASDEGATNVVVFSDEGIDRVLAAGVGEPTYIEVTPT